MDGDSATVLTGGERTTAIRVLPVERAAGFLAHEEKSWGAELYGLGARLRAHSSP
jgi:hypothetical protein